MKKILYPIFITFIALLFQNCEPDFDIYADNRDITIAYALLDVHDSIHYVKVYKGFQSTGSPLDDAQNMENLYYFDKITVTLEEYQGKELIQSIVLDTTTSIPRENGTFAAPQQLLYTNNIPFTLDPTYLPYNIAKQFHLQNFLTQTPHLKCIVSTELYANHNVNIDYLSQTIIHA